MFKRFKNGEKITVLYNPQKPQLANVYSVWGYWLRWEELLVSIFLIIGLYYLATSITQNPNPESLLQQMEEEDKPQRKYT